LTVGALVTLDVFELAFRAALGVRLFSGAAAVCRAFGWHSALPLRRILRRKTHAERLRHSMERSSARSELSPFTMMWWLPKWPFGKQQR
jgi:hypothetical protein